MKKYRPLAEADEVHSAAYQTKQQMNDSCFSPFSCLPDEVVLEILKKVMDLKTLCVCEVVSKRFYAIVHQVDTICYTTVYPSSMMMKSMRKFNRVKSLCIHRLLSPRHREQLFMWKLNLGVNGSDSFVFVSPTSVFNKNNGLLLHEQKRNVDKVSLALSCVRGVQVRLFMLSNSAINLPLLEKVTITDLDNRGRGRVSMNGNANIDELRNLKRTNCPNRKSECYVPLLELPVSGYVMKGVTLVLMDWNDVPCDVTYDTFINDEIDFEQDKEEAAYHEAVTEIFKKHSGSIVRLK